MKTASVIHCFCALESCSTVQRVHNLCPCTEFLFPVYSRSYSIMVRYFFYLPNTHVLYISSGNFCAPEYCSVFDRIKMFSAYIQWSYYITRIFSTYLLVCNGLVDRAPVFHAAGPRFNPAWCVFNIFSFNGFFRYITRRHRNCAVYGQ